MGSVMRSILTGLEAARCRVLARCCWGFGTRGWGGGAERGIQGISATIGPQSSHPPLMSRWHGDPIPTPTDRAN
jgi:hypothetical protein